jgi:hypothetical protein
MRDNTYGAADAEDKLGDLLSSIIKLSEWVCQARKETYRWTKTHAPTERKLRARPVG